MLTFDVYVLDDLDQPEVLVQADVSAQDLEARRKERVYMYAHLLFAILYFLMVVVLEKDVTCRYCSAFKPVYLNDQGICPKCSERRVCSKCKCRRQAHYYTSTDAEVCYFCLPPPSNTQSSVQNLFQEQPLHVDPTILDVDMLIRSLQSPIADKVDRRVSEQG